MVIHFNVPRSPATYVQEIGRAGRDGLPAKCVTFLSRDDVPLVEGFAYGQTPTLAELRHALAAIFPDGSSKGSVVKLNLWSLRDKVSDETVYQLLTHLELAPAYGFLADIHPQKAPKRKKNEGKEELGSKRATATRSKDDELVTVAYTYLVVSPPPPLDDLAVELLDHRTGVQDAQLDRLWDIIGVLTSPLCHTAALAARFGTPAERRGAPPPCGACEACRRPSTRAARRPWARGTAADVVPADRWAAATGSTFAAARLRSKPRALALHLCGMVNHQTAWLANRATRGALADVDFRAVLAQAIASAPRDGGEGGRAGDVEGEPVIDVQGGKEEGTPAGGEGEWRAAGAPAQP